MAVSHESSPSPVNHENSHEWHEFPRIKNIIPQAFESFDNPPYFVYNKYCEDYPEDKYGPSCLILGFTKEDRPIHVQCSLEPVWIITCYDPSQKPLEWDEYFKERR
jgi:hypothetical protein